MALDPKSKDVLTRYTMAAKKIIYDPERMSHVMQMLGTPQGALTAVQSVLSVLKARKPVPPAIVPVLGVNIYLAMVDVAQESTKTEDNPMGIKADAGVMKGVIQSIISALSQQQSQQQPAQKPQQPQQATQKPAQGGLMASMQGAPA